MHISKIYETEAGEENSRGYRSKNKGKQEIKNNRPKAWWDSSMVEHLPKKDQPNFSQGTNPWAFFL